MVLISTLAWTPSCCLLPLNTPLNTRPLNCSPPSFPSPAPASQPSMGALVNALHNSDLDTGLDPQLLLPLNTYWEQTRELYSPFECNMKAVSSDVYQHEMPGGQV